jgi:protein-S-isoprenylcysteine O-methyltransferase Ste14
MLGDCFDWESGMKGLNKKALAGPLCVLLVMAVLLFLPARSLGYWQAWVFLTVFGLCELGITLYLMKRDRHLLERRVYAGPTAEKERTQKIIQSITSLGFIAMLVVPALDHRFHWSEMPLYASVGGDVLLALGFLIVFFVCKENTFASAIIEVAPEQQVISTGLYALVRHPMYMGGIFWFVGMALSLGSWWGLFVFLLVIPALIWRIFDEEELLSKRLRGYTEYCDKVRYRLMPFVW